MGIFSATMRRLAGANTEPAGERVRATWNGAVIAESDATVVVEGNHYFPPEAVASEHLRPSDRQTRCPWKGRASYYDVVVGEQVGAAAAWYYPDPSDAAARIKDHVAFSGGVRVEPVGR